MKNKIEGLLRVSLVTACFLVLDGCKDSSNREAVEGFSMQTSLEMKGSPFQLQLSDVNGDGRKDILAVDHAGNEMRMFVQDANRTRFDAYKAPFKQVGFHPGDLITWPEDSALMLMGAEGASKILALTPAPATDDGMRVVSEMAELLPRYVRYFKWPGWGASLAVSPYVNGALILLKGYDPEKGQAAERLVIPLSEQPNTLRSAERITVADIDGDGVDELILAFSATEEIMVVRFRGDKAPTTEILWRNEGWGMPNQVTVFDMNKDGYPDLLIPDESAPSRINMLINHGNFKFTEATPLEFPGKEGIYEFRVGVDHDNRRYLLAAGDGNIAIYQIPVEWSWGKQIPYKTVSWTRQGDLSRDMCFEDIDGDGWLDLALGRVTSDRNIWIAYGSLWQTFDELSNKGFKLN